MRLQRCMLRFHFARKLKRVECCLTVCCVLYLLPSYAIRYFLCSFFPCFYKLSSAFSRSSSNSSGGRSSNSSKKKRQNEYNVKRTKSYLWQWSFVHQIFSVDPKERQQINQERAVAYVDASKSFYGTFDWVKVLRSFTDCSIFLFFCVCSFICLCAFISCVCVCRCVLPLLTRSDRSANIQFAITLQIE